MEVCNISIKRLKNFTMNESDGESISLQLGGTVFRFSYKIVDWLEFVSSGNEKTNIDTVKKLPKTKKYKGNPL